MEDFLKFLLIAGVILVGIFKEVNKNSKSKKAKNKKKKKKKKNPPRPADTLSRRSSSRRHSYARSLGQTQVAGRTVSADSRRAADAQTESKAAGVETEKEKRRSIRCRLYRQQCRTG